MFVTNSAHRKERHRSEPQTEENSHDQYPHEPRTALLSQPFPPLELRRVREERLVEIVENRLERLRHIVNVVIDADELQLSLPNAVQLRSTPPFAPTCRSVLLKSSSSIWNATGLSFACLNFRLNGNAERIEFTARSHCL